MVFGGGLSPEFMADPKAGEYVATLKTLLDEVNVEDRGCTEKVFRGLSAASAKAGHLSYLERPIYDFHAVSRGANGRFRPALCACGRIARSTCTESM